MPYERMVPRLPGPADAVLSAAVLVVTAFRMRDEDGLIETIRSLTSAVEAWQASDDQQPAAEPVPGAPSRPDNAKRLAHVWRAWRFAKSVCGCCGLIGLNNDATRRAARAACPGTPED